MTPGRSHSASPARKRGAFSIDVEGRTLHFATQPGVFSQDAPDEGTMLVLETVLPRVRPHQRVLDLGAGVGILGISLAGRLPRGEVWMVDSDVRAVRLCQENVEANSVPNAHIVLSDITLDLPDLHFDLVVSNPPTHSGKDVLSGFVTESYDVLRPGGSLYVVVNRLLSIREMIAETFGTVEQVNRRKGFIILRGEKVRKRPE